MNERDLKIGEMIKAEIEKGDRKKVIKVPQQFLARGNLIILKVLLQDEGMKGVAVVLDRPHQYLAYLLHLHKINQKNISYVDAITHFSGEKIEGDGSITYTDGPFHIELLVNAFSEGYGTGFKSRSINLREVDFILIDNIATMLSYNTLGMITGFLDDFFEVINGINTIMTIIPIDSRAHKELYNVLKEHVSDEVDMLEVWR